MYLAKGNFIAHKSGTIFKEKNVFILPFYIMRGNQKLFAYHWCNGTGLAKPVC